MALDQGETVPRDARRFSGLVFMGGPMSVNDDLPWIIPALELVRDAVRKDVPVLGHCLGGQLMSKAFGGNVTANKVKEIGWGEVRVADNGVARAWLGDLPAFESFHWHGETFSIPPGATRILEGEHCANQAFAIGKHLGMQCHVEMTPELVRDAVRKDVPVLGHCLGGQLMSKAFGGTVTANRIKEIGWGEVRVADNGVARAWLGDLPAFESFHWHGETFSIPPGATRILEGEHCPNQAFAIGKHLGMQCHVEMTDELVKTWLETGGKEIQESKNSPAVQRPEDICRDLEMKLGRLNEVATKLYDRWSGGLSRGS